MPTLVSSIRIISILLTALICVSFLLFVWDEMDSTSKTQLQRATIDAEVTVNARDAHGRISKPEQDIWRTKLDSAADNLVSPGERLGKNVGSDNPWAIRILALIFGLLVFFVGPRMLADWIEQRSRPPVSQAHPVDTGSGYDDSL